MSFASVVSCRSEGNMMSWITCYDYSFARAVSESGVDFILVGDSGSMVALGERTTSPATMDQMINFAKAVRKGAPSKPIVGDLPRGSYEPSDELAVLNAMRFAKEADCEAVKLEGGARVAQRVAAIVGAGIPVIGHIGLTPQSSAQFGGYRVTGRSSEEEKWLVSEATALEQAGVSAILVEATPPLVSKKIRDSLSVPVFGIGAGPNLDGQLLIIHDVLGLYPDFRPKFAKNYLLEALREFTDYLEDVSDLVQFGRDTRRDGLYELSVRSLNHFAKEVAQGVFPSTEYHYAEKGAKQ